MNASRAQLVEQVIRPALERDEIVVCDRFADSTLAYQGAGRGLELDELSSVISFATAGLRPDMTLLLDVPVEVGLARKHTQEQSNRFEAEALAFHTRVQAAIARWPRPSQSAGAASTASRRWIISPMKSGTRSPRGWGGVGMKLVVAVVQSEDASGLLTQLSNRGFRATRIKTVGRLSARSQRDDLRRRGRRRRRDRGAHDPPQLHDAAAADHRDPRGHGARRVLPAVPRRSRSRRGHDLRAGRGALRTGVAESISTLTLRRHAALASCATVLH